MVRMLRSASMMYGPIIIELVSTCIIRLAYVLRVQVVGSEVDVDATDLTCRPYYSSNS